MRQTDKRLRDLAQAERIDTTGAYEEKLRATLQSLPRHEGAPAQPVTTRAPGRLSRRAALAILAAALLLGGAAIAAERSGLVAFWERRGAGTEGAEYVERPLAGTGDALSLAEFTVCEAVFDGRALQTVVEVRPRRTGTSVLTEDYDVSEWNEYGPGEEGEALIALCGFSRVGAQTAPTGAIESLHEDGALVYYNYELLSQETNAQAVPVEMACFVYPETDIGAMESTTIAFEVQRVRAKTCKIVQAMDMGAFEIVSADVAYTPLGVDLTLTYVPGARLGQAGISPYLITTDGGQIEPVLQNRVQRTLEDGREAFDLTLRFACPDTLPEALRLGVQGIEGAAVFDLGNNTLWREGEDAR